MSKFFHFWFLLIVFLTFKGNNLLAQQHKSFPFQLNGKMNTDTGTVTLTLVVDSNYYPKDILQLSAKVFNGKFSIKGILPYPHPFYLQIGDSYRSDVFIIDPGIQSITVNVDSNRVTPLLDNSSMKEYDQDYLSTYKEFKLQGKQLDKRWDSLKKAFKGEIPPDIKAGLEKELRASYLENDRLLLKYTTTHPGSYFAFWKLVHLLGFGYQDIFSEILPRFSDVIKQTPAGELATQKIAASNILATGKKFPLIPCIDAKNEPLSQTSLTKNKYTLIDFWYSSCGPCIATFPDLKKVYEKYKTKGFEIISISTDQKKKRKDWLQAIDKYQLKWPQYWDLDGIESAKLSILAFPKTYLINQKGEIVNADIKAAELEEFLKEALL